MRRSLQRILIGTAFFIATLGIAVIGYVMAGWTIVEALYMVVITIFGVGYGEVRPVNTPFLRLFTIFVILAGTSSAVYLVGGFVQMITEGEINKALGARRMTREIEQLEQHVVLCGFGRMGQILAKRLALASLPFIVIDQQADRVEQASALGYLVYPGNATDEAILKGAGIERAKTLTTVLPDDAANVFITLTARGLNPNLQILARGEWPSTEKKLRLAGADQVVLPASISAQRMAHMITHPATLDFLNQDDGRRSLNELLAQVDIQVDELVVSPGSPMEGATIGDVEVRGKGTFIVVALIRADGTTVNHPDQTIVVYEGDTIIVMGHRGDVPQFVQRHVVKRALRYRGSSV
ncbi:potassium channel protein [Synechococcales cyanobacterium C]|uniref:Potassium channel protein n=1 Tax=Petrachloros mirabilis ULC683 TaxID=2781853 RepID=A0A8K1ZWK1_9CYAN|nr:potassium channel protein [Petrachloros mirabilis]NCJ05381.1 potassium channel protein [Petrachloros mirabilis ULC683]